MMIGKRNPETGPRALRRGAPGRRRPGLAALAPMLAAALAIQSCSLSFPAKTKPLYRADAAKATPAAETQPNAEPGYQIGPEDVLDISVWKEDELHREVLVRPDGGISFPLAGDIPAAGKTPEQLQDELTRRIRRYVPAAVVTVSVSKISGYRVYIIGKVNNPGQFVVGRYVDVMQALTLAGGLTPYASENKIRIIRRNAKGEQVFPFEYSRVKSGNGLDQNILLESGDVVVVP